jgi:hypothetical protein
VQHAESLQDRTEGPLPTFLIIGVPKAGTTSLYHYCRQHPEVFMPSQKEPRFFAFEGRSVDAQDPVNQSVVKTIDAYRDLFAEDADAPARGEASPSCLATPKAAARIDEEHVPDVRMIAILREDLLSFGGGDTLGSMLNFSARKGDYLLVGRLMDASALGIYSRAYGLMNQANSVIGIVLNRVMFSSLSSVQDDPERLGRAYRRGVALLALLVLPLSVFMIVMAPEVIYAALGPQWSEAVVPFQILTVGMFFRASGKVSGPVPKARGRVYRMAWRKGVYAACVFAGVYAGIQYGLPGVAVGVLGAIAVIALLLAQLAPPATPTGSSAGTSRPTSSSSPRGARGWRGA